MSSSKRLVSLETDLKLTNERIALLEQLRILRNNDFMPEQNVARRYQINIEIENYSKEIDGLYNKLDEIEAKIRQLQSVSSQSTSNEHSTNPRNQQELSFEESLCELDFDKPVATFNQIPVQFNKSKDTKIPLFFLEDSFDKKGELYLKRLKSNLTPAYRNSFCEHSVQYDSGNVEAVIQGIGHKFGVERKDLNFEEYINLVITKICDSLQSNSVLFIEIIECNLRDETDIKTCVDMFLPSFTNKFWNPLQKEIENIAQAYYGIKVIVMMSSEYNLNLKEKLSMNKIDCPKTEYYYFRRDDLLNIILENWSSEDVRQWLKKYCHRGFTIDKIEEIIKDIDIKTDGSPVKICYDLQQRWYSLITSP